MRRRVVVTGVGLVCAVGVGTEPVWQALLAGQGGVNPITHFDATAFDCRIAAEVHDFDPLAWIPKKELKKMGRFIQLAVASADSAMRMAQLEITPAIADSHRRLHFFGHRWIRHHRARTLQAARGWSGTHHAVFHPRGDH